MQLYQANHLATEALHSVISAFQETWSEFWLLGVSCLGIHFHASKSLAKLTTILRKK